MQAIILAAGMGRRLGNLTQGNTKCMLEVNGKRLIDRMLGQLAALQPALKRVVIVAGYKRENLKRHVAELPVAQQLNITWVDNPIYDRTNNIYSLALAKELMVEDDTLLLESDLIFDSALLQAIVDDPHPDLALVDKYRPWMDGTMVTINERGTILNFVPKAAFRQSLAHTYYKTVNIYKFSRSFAATRYVPFLEAYSKAMGDNEYYEQVLRVITALDNSALQALPVNGRGQWYEIDDVQDLDIAEAMFADTPAEKLARLTRRYGGYWRFTDMLDFCYLVNPYFPPERMLDEIKASFDTLVRDYPSGQGINSLLGAKYFGLRQEQVAVGNGAAELIKAAMEHGNFGRMGIITPSFEEYVNRLKPGEYEEYVPDNDCFSYTADDLIAYFTAHPVDTLLVVNPDNPSGNFMPMEQLLKLLGWTAEKGMKLIVDESFVDFAAGYPANTLLSSQLLDANKHLAVMKSISKSYGVPGLRLGVFVSGDAELINAVKRDIAIWNINSFAEYYMQIFGKYEKAYSEACALIQHERDRFFAELENIDMLRAVPSQANYVLCEVRPPFTAKALTLELLFNHNILIKDCSTKRSFGGREYVRIAVRDRKDNDRLISVLKSL